MKKFILTTILLFTTRGYDVFTTYKYIPDLRGETNPLVVLFNLGWTGSLIVQFTALCFLTYCLYIHCFRKIHTIDVEASHSLKQFISIFHFNNPNDLSKLLYRLPTNHPSLLYSIGAIVPQTLIIISLIVGTSTMLLLFHEPYQLIYKAYHIPVFLYITMIVIAGAVAVEFYKKERNARLLKTVHA